MMKIITLLLLPFLVLSCSNPMKAEESDRKNLYQTEFFFDGGFYGRALMHAKKVKKSSPRFQEAQEWIQRIQSGTEEPEFPE